MNATPGKAERKYLARQAEPEAALADALTEGGVRYGHALCVPAYAEDEDLFRLLASVPEGPRGDVLITLVVNERDGAPEEARRANRSALADLREAHALTRRLDEDAELLEHPRGALLLIDRTREGNRLPDRQGVGLARKIGADIALAVSCRGGLHSPWIHCTDADAALPSDYFHRVPTCDDADLPAALLYPFRHEPDAAASDPHAILRYEIYLRYYVLGLRFAGSPYAFHTLGSTLALQRAAYARVRGFPRRLAGEDFHVLNKLAKVGAVVSLAGAPILLSGRTSERVPFGTGPAVRRELSRSREGESLPAYDPRVFESLGVWLRSLETLADRDGAGETDIEARVRSEARAARGVEVDPLLRALHDLGEIDAVRETLQRYGSDRLAPRLRERFDALRTLKLVHALREACLPSIPLEQALARAPFLDLDADAIARAARDPEALLAHLIEREQS